MFRIIFPSNIPTYFLQPFAETFRSKLPLNSFAETFRSILSLNSFAQFFRFILSLHSFAEIFPWNLSLKPSSEISLYNIPLHYSLLNPIFDICDQANRFIFNLRCNLIINYQMHTYNSQYTMHKLHKGNHRMPQIVPNIINNECFWCHHYIKSGGIIICCYVSIMTPFISIPNMP